MDQMHSNAILAQNVSMIYFVCDGDNNCQDYSDEKNCTEIWCLSHKFKCANNHCVSCKWLCDGMDDCLDNSDERDCHMTCAYGEFKCANASKCIRLKMMCDGNNI